MLTRALFYATVQTHLQAGKGLADSSFVSFVRREGMVRLWRGAPAVLLGCIPSHAAYFSAYELGKETLGVNAPGHHPLAAAATGALATMLHDGILTPMDVMKQRLQLGYYNGLRHCIQQVAAQEGIAAFWRSYPTTLLMNMPYAACVVAANESFKKLWLPITGADSVVTYLLSGAGAGAIAAALTCPLDVIKTRLQTASLLSAVGDRGKGSGGGSGGISTGAASGSSSSGSSGSSTSGGRDARLPKGLFPAVNAQVAMLYTSPPGRHQRLGAVDIARALWAEEGVKGFFRGARARMAVHTPSQAISWAAYETAKAALVKLTGKE